MAASNQQDMEKNLALQVDDVATSEKDLKAQEASSDADYTGAVAKTDPAEIALVKKLDRRVMPALFCMYFLYVNSAANISNKTKQND